VKILFYPMLKDFRNSIALWKVHRLRPFVLPVTATVKGKSKVIPLQALCGPEGG
jgi:hypothetical protein